MFRMSGPGTLFGRGKVTGGHREDSLDGCRTGAKPGNTKAVPEPRKQVSHGPWKTLVRFPHFHRTTTTIPPQPRGHSY